MAKSNSEILVKVIVFSFLPVTLLKSNKPKGKNK